MAVFLRCGRTTGKMLMVWALFVYMLLCMRDSIQFVQCSKLCCDPLSSIMCPY